VNGARLTIDLGALAHNYRALQAAAPGAEVAPVVKADGYGLGAGPIARRLWAEGARSFFVARLSEGEALRKALGEKPAEIYVLDGLTDTARTAAAALTPALTSLEQIAAWAALAGSMRLPCALHFDTGMNRLGLAVDEASEAARLIAAAPGLELKLVMSHLSYATTPSHPRNAEQLARFRKARAAFPGVPASLAASSGCYLGPDYRFEVVRPGISLYGGGPEEQPHPDIRAVVTLEAPILQIRRVKAGESVGYGRMFTADHDVTLAIIEAGYADGFLRTGHARSQVAVCGRLCPLAIVSMDLIAVDISALPDTAVGDRVELLGPTALLDHAAEAAGTVAHECLVRLSPRAERVYRD
jgi:alanine racemase